MYEDKDPEACHALVAQGWKYLDVRTPDEFTAGHPEGATNVPVALLGPGGMMPNPMFLQVVQRLYGPQTKLVVGCASGGRSARACQMLGLAGFTTLVNVAGGFSGIRNSWGAVEQQGWAGLGLPSSSGDDEGSYAAVQARLRPPSDQG